MARGPISLLAGRNTQPLSANEQSRISNTCLGIEPAVNFKVESGQRTRFRVIDEGGNNEIGEIVFGEDVYPGNSAIDPNSSLSLKCAIAHELTHYFRWFDKTEIMQDGLIDLDEALTSLEAILRYYKHLTDNEQQQLMRDAIQRIQIYVAKF